MTDTPEDLIATAEAIEQEMIDLPRCTRQACVEIMAKALLAERERCAKIAECATEFYSGLPSHHENNIRLSEDIRVAKLIRTSTP